MANNLIESYYNYVTDVEKVNRNDTCIVSYAIDYWEPLNGSINVETWDVQLSIQYHVYFKDGTSDSFRMEYKTYESSLIHEVRKKALNLILGKYPNDRGCGDEKEIEKGDIPTDKVDSKNDGVYELPQNGGKSLPRKRLKKLPNSLSEVIFETEKLSKTEMPPKKKSKYNPNLDYTPKIGESPIKMLYHSYFGLDFPMMLDEDYDRYKNKKVFGVYEFLKKGILYYLIIKIIGKGDKVLFSRSYGYGSLSFFDVGFLIRPLVDHYESIGLGSDEDVEEEEEEKIEKCCLVCLCRPEECE
jgi:hypothetical protein